MVGWGIERKKRKLVKKGQNSKFGDKIENIQ